MTLLRPAAGTRLAAGLGWLAAAAFLTAGMPLFVRMPPWCDLTLYDMAARAVMHGGTHYQDIFDTNLPGFVWTLIGVRRCFGTSYEAVRSVDLVIVGLIAGLLAKLVKRSGGTAAGIAWMVASIAAFYPFTSEFSHCQRDIWMTLPILMAVMVRLKHRVKPNASRLDFFLEGLIWGVAVWFKPHVLFIAWPVWLITKSKIPRGRDDFYGNLWGGGIVGILGIGWLIVTGTWKPFVEVFTKWNSSYLLTVWSETPQMAERFLRMSPPFSLLHLVAIPLAIRTLRRRKTDESHDHRAVLATIYLAVLLQACVLQRNFDYVHIPEMFLLFAVLAAHGGKVVALLPLTIAFAILGPMLLNGASPWLDRYCPPHPVLNQQRMSRWLDCFQAGLPPLPYRERQQALALSYEYFPAINVVELGEVADFLRTQTVTDGDVIAWHDSPHAVYLDLGIGTNFRFMHVTTTLLSDQTFIRMTIELRKKALPTARFMVTDMMHPLRASPAAIWDRRRESGPNRLPPVLNAKAQAAFPYCLPVLFRSGNGHGRYLVHRVTPEILADLDSRRVHFEFEFELWDEP